MAGEGGADTIIAVGIIRCADIYTGNSARREERRGSDNRPIRLCRKPRVCTLLVQPSGFYSLQLNERYFTNAYRRGKASHPCEQFSIIVDDLDRNAGRQRGGGGLKI